MWAALRSLQVGGHTEDIRAILVRSPPSRTRPQEPGSPSPAAVANTSGVRDPLLGTKLHNSQDSLRRCLLAREPQPCPSPSPEASLWPLPPHLQIPQCGIGMYVESPHRPSAPSLTQPCQAWLAHCFLPAQGLVPPEKPQLGWRLVNYSSAR